MNRYKSNKYGRLQRMWETYRMWQIVRFLLKHRFTLALELNAKVSKEKARNILANNVTKVATATSKELGRELTHDEFEDIFKEEMKDEKEFSDFLAWRDVDNYHKEAVVDRKAFVELYLSTQFKKIYQNDTERDLEERLKDRQFQTKKLEINSLIESCTDNEHGYITYNDEESKHIQLTAKGKKFAGIDGLLKVEIEEVGKLWTVIATAIAVVGTVRFDWIKYVTGYISPWW